MNPLELHAQVLDYFSAFRLRVKLAWWAFNFQPFEVVVGPLAYAGGLGKGAVCDNNRRFSECENEATTCLSRTVVRFQVSSESDHYHVCDFCAQRYTGSWEEEITQYEMEKLKVQMNDESVGFLEEQQ